MLALAHKVKAHEVSREEIDKLVEFAKVSGGIEYADVVCGTSMLKRRLSLISMLRMIVFVLLFRLTLIM